MSKLVLDVEINKELSENDVITYDNGKWTVVSRDIFLRNINAKITELQRKNRELNEKIENISTNISTLANIIKETVK